MSEYVLTKISGLLVAGDGTKIYQQKPKDKMVKRQILKFR